MHQVLIDDLVNVVLVHIRVPNALRINHDYRAEFTAVETSGAINSQLGFAGEAKRLDASFGVVAHGLGVVIGATSAAVVALVDAEEHVVAVVRHAHSIKNAARRRLRSGARCPYCRRMNANHFSALDRLIGAVDQAVRVIFGPPPNPTRPSPAVAAAETELAPTERELAGRLMRVNHIGEICAQALYQGQSVSATRPDVRTKLERAAAEENDHLAWTAARVEQLGTHTSYLNPVWYVGSFALGVAAGLAGDKWSLGFLAETERQVVTHLDGHLQRLPAHDTVSRAIVEQMREDEGRHATVAAESGAAPLPAPIPQLMRMASGVMVRVGYWI